MNKASIVAISIVIGLTTIGQAQSSGEIQDFHERQMDRYRQDGMMALPKMKLSEVKLALESKFKYPIKSAQTIISPPVGAPYKDFTIVSKIRIYAGSSIRVSGPSAHPYIHVKESFVASQVELIKRSEPKTDLERQEVQRRSTGNPSLDRHYKEMGAFPHRAFGTNPGESAYFDVRGGTYQVVFLVTQIRSYEVYDGINWPTPDFARKYSEAYLDSMFMRQSNPRWESLARWYPTGDTLGLVRSLLTGARSPEEVYNLYPSVSRYEETNEQILVRNNLILGKCGIHATSIQAYAKSLAIPYFLVNENFNPIGKVWSDPGTNAHLSCWLWDGARWRSSRFPWEKGHMTKRETFLLHNGMGALSFWRNNNNQIAEYPLVIEATAEL